MAQRTVPAIGVILVLALSAGADADPPDATLQRAAAYVARFEDTFAAVVWHERYVQEDRVQRQFRSSGTRFLTLSGRRTLDSELLFIWLPKDASWIAVRDVMSVDGKPIAPADRPVRKALTGSPVSLDRLRELARSNGRFNIGEIVRTFNEPTLALLFLDDQYRHRFTFSARGEERTEGRRAAKYEFAEEARPTVIQDGHADVPSRGMVWIDPGTGQILRTTLDLTDAVGRLGGHIEVTYQANLKFDVLVPVAMRETYASAVGERVTTVASYDDFRRFETAGRVILPK